MTSPAPYPPKVGKGISVPFEVARDVGQIRGNIGRIDRYTGDEYTKKGACSKIKRHRREGLPVPDDRHFIIELFENFAVIHAPFGMNVNQTLGRIFSLLLTAKL